MLIGVYGTNEGRENTPDSPPGVLLPPPAPRVGERLVRQRAAKLGIPVIPFHRAVLTRRLDAERLPGRIHPGNPRAQRILAQAMHERAACFWATPCGRGCAIRATYQSPTVHLPPALATGNLDLLTRAMAREVTLDRRDRASGVTFIDKATGREAHAAARAVVLAASAAESVRLLLNSRSARFPDGLANRSGRLGRYLMDTVGAGLGGQIPLLENLPPLNEDGAGGAHVYVPWWLYREQQAGRLDFPRGYHIEFGGGRAQPGVGSLDGILALAGGGYGRRLKEDARRYYGSFLSFSGRGEMIPNEGSYCELDPAVKDRWGLPVLRFHWQWSDHEIRQAAHMQRTFAAIIGACGGRHPPVDPTGRQAIAPGGQIIHEVGGAMMGADPATSVTNRWGQTWDVPNLCLADGAVFCSNADKNPTLTIMALAWRTSEHLLDALRRGDL